MAVDESFSSAYLTPFIMRGVAHVQDSKRVCVGEEINFWEKLAFDRHLHRFQVESVKEFASAGVARRRAAEKFDNKLNRFGGFFLQDGADRGRPVTGEIFKASNGSRDGEVGRGRHIRIDRHVVIIMVHHGWSGAECGL